MKLFLKTLYITSIIFTLLFSYPYKLKAAPAVSFSFDRGNILVNKIFSLELIASWEGDSDRYLIAPPQISFPEGIEEKGSSFSTTSKEGHYSLYYKYQLLAQKEGEYALKPIEISYWEKGNNKEEKVKTNALHFKVTSFSSTYLTRFWLPGILIAVFLGLFIALAVLYKKKKRLSNGQKSDATITRELIAGELEQCNAYKIKGDWGNYFKKILSIRNKLPNQDKIGTLMEDLDTLVEKVTYGGLHPTSEEINLIQRQIEKAFKSAFPKDGDKDLDGIKLR